MVRGRGAPAAGVVAWGCFGGIGEGVMGFKGYEEGGLGGLGGIGEG